MKIFRKHPRNTTMMQARGVETPTKHRHSSGRVLHAVPPWFLVQEGKDKAMTLESNPMSRTTLLHCLCLALLTLTFSACPSDNAPNDPPSMENEASEPDAVENNATPEPDAEEETPDLEEIPDADENDTEDDPDPDMDLPDLPEIEEEPDMSEPEPMHVIPQANPGPFQIDGDFSDWEGYEPLILDPEGDSDERFDLTYLYARTHGTVVHLRFDTTNIVGIQAGNVDDGDIRFVFDLPEDRELSVDLRNQRIRMLSSSGVDNLPWFAVNLLTAPTYAANEYEIQIDLGPAGAELGDTVELQVEGSDRFSHPVSISLAHDPLPTLQRSPEKEDPSHLRIASLNTKDTGLFDAERSPGIRRLLKAAKADIYCLQEQYSTTEAEHTEALNNLDPHNDDAPWYAHKVRDNVTISRHPQIPLDLPYRRFAASVVRPSNDESILVINAHLSCCGIANDESDLNRIEQAEQILESIQRFREGLLGPELREHRNAPIVVVGDWNLVGSRTPLDTLTLPQEPDLQRWLLSHLHSHEVWTWRNQGSDFTPGQLDLLIHSSEGLQRHNGFLLYSDYLSPETLDALGLDRADSRATDHTLMVADFSLEAP